MSAIQEAKIFDPADGFAPFIDVANSLIHVGALLAATGWCLTPHPQDPKRESVLWRRMSQSGMRPQRRQTLPVIRKRQKTLKPGNWVEQIYFAGAAKKSLGSLRHRLSWNGRTDSKVWLGSTPVPEATGLRWFRCNAPSSNFSDWSQPIQIMIAQDRGWHTGP
jgi:hypothetical protein